MSVKYWANQDGFSDCKVILKDVFLCTLHVFYAVVFHGLYVIYFICFCFVCVL